MKNYDGARRDRIRPPKTNRRKEPARKRNKEVENVQKISPIVSITKADLDAFFTQFQNEFTFYEKLEQLHPLQFMNLYLDDGRRYFTTELTLEGYYTDEENEYSYDLGPNLAVVS